MPSRNKLGSYFGAQTWRAELRWHADSAHHSIAKPPRTSCAACGMLVLTEHDADFRPAPLNGSKHILDVCTAHAEDMTNTSAHELVGNEVGN